VSERNTTITMMVIYPCEGGSMRLDVKPAGADMAGVKLGSEVLVAMVR